MLIHLVHNLSHSYVHTPDLIATDDSAASLLLHAWFEGFSSYRRV